MKVANAGAAEEVVTIETDKIEVSVIAPAAGRITELLANEKDTVMVWRESPRRGESDNLPSTSRPILL